MNRYITDTTKNTLFTIKEKIFNKSAGNTSGVKLNECNSNLAVYYDIKLHSDFSNYKIGKAFLRLYFSDFKSGVTFKLHTTTREKANLDDFTGEKGNLGPVLASVNTNTAQKIPGVEIYYFDIEITEQILKMIKIGVPTNFIILNDSNDNFIMYGMKWCLENKANRCFILATDEGGLDGKFEYQQQSAGFAGIGNVNLSTGKLLFSFQGPSTEATDIPFTLEATYNKANTALGALGKYWRSNLEFGFAMVSLSSDGEDAILTDHTGKGRHYLKYDKMRAKIDFGIDQGNEYGELLVCPFDGTYMLINDKDLTRKLFDQQGNYLAFSADSNNYLKEMQMVSGKALDFPILYSFLGLGGKRSITSSDNRIVNISLSLNRITRIDYPYECKSLRFIYDDSLLTKIEFLTKTDAGEEVYKSCQYEYDTNEDLVAVYDLMTNQGVKYTYNAGKIEKIEQVLLNSSESGPYLTIKYDDNWTKTTNFLGEETNCYFNNFGICTLVTNSENKAVSRNFRLISIERGVELSNQSLLVMMDSVNLLDNGDFGKDISLSSPESAWRIIAGNPQRIGVKEDEMNGGKYLAIDKQDDEEVIILQNLSLKNTLSLSGQLRYRSKDGSKMKKGDVTIEMIYVIRPGFDTVIEPINHHDGWIEFAIPNIKEGILAKAYQLKLTMRGKAANIGFANINLVNGDKPIHNNLIKNGSFALSDGIRPTDWIITNMNDREDFLLSVSDDSWPKHLGGKFMHFGGELSKVKTMEIIIPVSGEGGEKFAFSFFTRGFYSETDVAQGFVKIGDNRYDFPLEKGNPSWQMVSGIVTTECGFTSVKVGFEYCSSGQVDVGGFYLYRFAEASSYNYSNDTILSRYNAKDKTLTLTDRLGSRTQVQYDKDLPVSIIDSFNNRTISSYNRFGQCLAQTTNTPEGLRTEMSAEYDNEARIKKSTDNDGQVTSLDYSKEEGVYEIIQQTDPNKLVSSLKLDKHGRPYVLTSDGIQCDYVYGTDGSLNSINTPVNGKYETILDAWGRTEKVMIDDNIYFTNKYELLKNGINTGLLTTRLYINNANSLKITYSYDEKYRLSSIKFNDVEKVNLSYDQLNQLIQITDKATKKKLYFAYDQIGNLIRKSDSDSTSSEYILDDTGAIQRTIHSFDNQECHVDYDYPHEYISANHTSYFQRVTEYLGHDAIRDDQKGRGIYGATPLINTVKSGFEDNKVIHSMIFDKDISTVLYDLRTVNSERKRHRGKGFDQEQWKSDFQKDKVAYAWIKPTGTYTDQLLLAFASPTARYYSLSVNSSGNLVLQSVFAAPVATNAVLKLDNWNLIALQLDGTNGVIRAYLNDEVIECRDTIFSPLRLSVGNFLGVNEIASSNALEPRDGKAMKLQFRMAFLGIGNSQNFALSLKAIIRLGTRMMKEKLTSPFAGVSYGKEDIGNFDIIHLNGNLISRNGVVPNKNKQKSLLNGDNKFSMFEYDEELSRLVYASYPSGYHLKNAIPLVYNLGLGTEGTISLRVKIEDVKPAPTRNILTCVKDGKIYFQLLADSSTIKITTNSVTGLSTSRTLSSNKWHTITCSWNSLGLRLWLDSGTPFVSNTIIDLSNTQTFIGSNYIPDDSNRTVAANNLYGKMERLIFGHSSIEDSDLARLLKASRVLARTTYDQVGRIVGKEFGNATKQRKQYKYMPNGDRISLYVEEERNLNDNFYIKYEYDKVGNITKITEKKGQTEFRKITYQYDLLGRLLNEDDKLNKQKITYTYDDNGNILHKYYYEYEDDSEDIKKLIRKRLYRYEHSKENDYEYTMKDIITSVSDREMNGEVELNRVDIPYVYNSNMKGYPSLINGKALLWDGHLLAQYGNTQLKYNSAGIRTEKKNGNGDVTTYFLDNSKVLGIRWKSGTIGESKSMRFNYDHQDMLLGLNYNEREYFYMRDILGIIHGIINEQGKRLVEYAYDAWGVPTKMSICTGLTTEELKEAEAILALNPFIYKGYIYDKETSFGDNISVLYYLNSRYYDPNIGRFISPDSLQYLQPDQINGLNLYAYCVNNPVMFSDSTGHSPNANEIVKDFWGNYWKSLGNTIEKSINSAIEGMSKAFRFTFGAIMGIVGAAMTLSTLLLAGFTPVFGTANRFWLGVAMYGGFMMASSWDSKILKDLNDIHWNPFNTNAQIAAGANKVSFYKGQSIIHTSSFGGTFSAGIMFVDSEHHGDDNAIKHEWGHFAQLNIMGWGAYIGLVAAPSVYYNKTGDYLNYRGTPQGNRMYYSKIWERTAEWLGGAESSTSYDPFWTWSNFVPW